MFYRILKIYILSTILIASNIKPCDQSTCNKIKEKQNQRWQAANKFLKEFSTDNISNKDSQAYSCFLKLINRSFNLLMYQQGASIHLADTITHCQLLLKTAEQFSSKEDDQLYKSLQEIIYYTKQLVLETST